ncbi:Lrp/AsnC family transcriptional regulator [Candidatus Pacearchaeota archaeon]|nr:Lrp/AsnC family transcriptional regulator [Candidatus Pacearchaeota archaeon]
MSKLDKIDLKLLSELEKDSEQTLSKIAKKLKTSQQVISYRLKSLEERGILGGFYTIIDIAKLGYTSYRTMIRLSNITEEKHKEIINFLMKHKNVLWLVECGGRWDLIVNFTAKNIIHYNNIMKEFVNRFPKQMQNYDILTTLEVIYFGRDYFIKEARTEIKSSGFGGKWETISTDKTNLQILNLISENARINSVEIADKLKISPNTVLLRIKEMKKSGLIQGTKPLIHLENIGYSGYKALIKFQNLTEQKEKEIVNHVKSNANIVGAIKLVGLWDFESEFEVENKEQMLKITRNFRDKFKEIIKEFEVIPLFHEYRYNFFPGDLLNG